MKTHHALLIASGLFAIAGFYTVTIALMVFALFLMFVDNFEL